MIHGRVESLSWSPACWSGAVVPIGWLEIRGMSASLAGVGRADSGLAGGRMTVTSLAAGSLTRVGAAGGGACTTGEEIGADPVVAEGAARAGVLGGAGCGSRITRGSVRTGRPGTRRGVIRSDGTSCAGASIAGFAPSEKLRSCVGPIASALLLVAGVAWPNAAPGISAAPSPVSPMIDARRKLPDPRAKLFIRLPCYAAGRASREPLAPRASCRHKRRASRAQTVS